MSESMEMQKQSPRMGDTQGGLEEFFRIWGLWILGAFALIYYSSYYRAGLYPAAEGGVEGMVALRLLEGERPIIDTFLGYNLLWFYPIVGIFKLIGPSYTALRIYFLILCTLTGLLSFDLVRKCTHCARLAFLAGLLVLLIPGQMFRNYMAFMVVLNMTTFISAYVLPAGSRVVRILWMSASGITLALAWLIRVDVGFFLTCLGLGLMLIYPFGLEPTGYLMRRLGVAITGLLLALLLFSLVHLPFYRDAVNRGFGPEFVSQYEQWPEMIHFQGGKLIDSAITKVLGIFKKSSPMAETPLFSTPHSTTALPLDKNTTKAFASPQKSKEPTESQATLARRSLLAASARDRMLAFNLYLPILIGILLVAGAFLGFLIGYFSRSGIIAERSLILLTAAGCSLTLFPQYFFWRPDMVHLSEFMVPMTLTMLMGCFFAATTWKLANGFIRTLLGIFLICSTLTLILYYINACQSQSSGGIAVSQNKSLDFHAANGVHVKLSPSEYADARAIYRIITTASLPGEYVICYPYNPEINFMTDRPSYEYNFYVDNAMSPPDQFYKETLEKISSYHPVVFVVTNWEINNTDASAFKNWAWQTYDYIAQNYKLAYRRGNLEVFIRPDRFGLIPKLEQ